MLCACVCVCSISTVWYVYIKWMCDFTLKQFKVALKQPIINNTVVSVGNFFIGFSVSACSYFWTCVLFSMRYHLLAANQFTDPSCFVRLTLKIHESGRKKRYYRCFSLQPTKKKLMEREIKLNWKKSEHFEIMAGRHRIAEATRIDVIITIATITAFISASVNECLKMVEVEAFFRTILLKVWTCSAKQIFPFFFFTSPDRRTKATAINKQHQTSKKPITTLFVSAKVQTKRKNTVKQTSGDGEKEKKQQATAEKPHTHTYHHRFRAEQNKRHAESAIFIIVIDVTPFSF